MKVRADTKMMQAVTKATSVHEEPLNSRKPQGRDKGRGRRGYGTTKRSATGKNNDGGYTSTTSNGNLSDDSGHTPGRGRRVRRGNDGRDHCDRCRYRRNSTGHGRHDYPIRLSHQPSDDTQYDRAAQVGGAVGGNHVSLASCTQENIAFPAVMEIGSTTPPGDPPEGFMDTTASHHTVPAKSRLYQHVINKIDCDVRVSGSRGISTATSKGTLSFRFRNDRGELVPIHLEALIAPDLGASVFSVGALQQNGVTSNLLSIPQIRRHGNAAFLVSTNVLRIFVLHIFLDGQEGAQLTSLTTVDTDTSHRRMTPCRLRALKQLVEEFTEGEKYIDRSGAGTSTKIGHKRDYLQTNQTMDLGFAKIGVRTKVYTNAIAGTPMLTAKMTSGMVLETYGITDICPTKTPAEARPARIAEDPVFSTEDIALFTSTTGYLSYLGRYTTTETNYSEDVGEGYDLTADVDTDLAGDTQEEYSTMRVATRLVGAPVDRENNS